MNWEHAKNLEEIFENLIQTLTNKARVLNPKTRGFHGRSPDGGCSGPSPRQKKLDFKFVGNRVCPEWISKVKYKIDHISKTKKRPKKF